MFHVKPKAVPAAPGVYGTREAPIEVLTARNFVNQKILNSTNSDPNRPRYQYTQLVTLALFMPTLQDEDGEELGPIAKAAYRDRDADTYRRCLLTYARLINEGDEAKAVVDGSKVFNVQVTPLISREDEEQLVGQKEGDPMEGRPLFAVRDFDSIVQTVSEVDWDDEDEDEDEDFEPESVVQPKTKAAKSGRKAKTKA